MRLWRQSAGKTACSSWLFCPLFLELVIQGKLGVKLLLRIEMKDVLKMEREQIAVPECSGKKMADGSGSTRFQLNELEVTAVKRGILGINRWIDGRNSVCLMVLWTGT